MRNSGPPFAPFPGRCPELIARDKPLVELLQAGRFDFLMRKDEEPARGWRWYWSAQIV